MLVSMQPEFPNNTDLVMRLGDASLAALDNAQTAEHDRLAVETAHPGARKLRHCRWCRQAPVLSFLRVPTRVTASRPAHGQRQDRSEFLRFGITPFLIDRLSRWPNSVWRAPPAR